MKKTIRILALGLALAMLAGCASAPQTESTVPDAVQNSETKQETPHIVKWPESTVQIGLSDDGVTVDGVPAGTEPADVYLSHDIVYYEDRDAYDSGNAYGEGEDWERHSADEAAAHTVVNITAPGAYTLSGKLSAGQIRVDLGEEAFDDPAAAVTLVLDGVDITCSVAPAILFRNVYECDNGWSTETAKSTVDTAAAGAGLLLAEDSVNTVSGSHVARIYKDAEGEKKLWKQDGAIYSYMSMNVDGTGVLELTADNEGMDTELHLTVNGGDIRIRSGNDGINTNEDGVSVTTINGGRLHIAAGLGEEGDGIDSNGWLVINGGTVISAAHPAADAGLDSDMGSYVNGGTVVALGSTMDWAESESEQVTMNLQFASYRNAEDAIAVTKEGAVVFAYDPSADEVLGTNARQYMGAVISCPAFAVGDAYQVFVGGTLTGSETGGVYDAVTVTDYTGGVQQAYTGTDVMMGPGMGGFGGFGGAQGNFGGFGGNAPQEGWESFEPEDLPEGFDAENMPEMPQGGFEGFDGAQGNFGGFGGNAPQEGWENFGPEDLPEDFDAENMPEMPQGGFEGFGGAQGGFGGFGGQQAADGQTDEAQTVFYMQDKVNAFSGVADAAQ